MNWSLAEIAVAANGVLTPAAEAGLRVQGVVTDSRRSCQGALFVALKGERFDAHAYLAEAVAQGAAALLVSQPVEALGTLDIPVIQVEDTRLALGYLAAAWRQKFDIPLVAVTGSNGKTTTKEMLAGIFRAALGETAVWVTEGNLNNDIGLPMTLLGLRAGHQAAIVEMGMNHPGEISYLTRIAAPTVALVTNAQRAHLEGMGHLEGVAREKACIYEGLGESGVAVVNGDDAYANLWLALNQHRKTRIFSLAPSLTSSGDLERDICGEAQFHGLETRLVIRAPEGEVSVALQASGWHNAANALAAASAALAAGLDMTSIEHGLNRFAGVKGRLERRPGPKGAIILNDTYNANPDSVRAGIDVLASLPGRQILVLGDMGEIGAASGQYHDEVGGYAKSMGVDRLFALGDASQQSVRNFGEGAQHFRSVEALVQVLATELDQETTVLVKGSRFMKMERVVEALEKMHAEWSATAALPEGAD